MAREKLKSRRPWYIAVAVAVMIVIAIIVPLATILPKKHHHPKKTNVLFPLYIWPKTNTTWDPLYAELTTHAALNFTVIVNPSSGPGNLTYPPSELAHQVEQLNTYPNVRTVGYVRTGYATRNLSTILQEVDKYSGWAQQSASLAMHGIFFDEIPSEYTTSIADYLQTINDAAKSASGLRPECMVIHNPGAIPDPRYGSISTTDVTVMFEQSYTEYQTKKASLSALRANRTNSGYMIHSVRIFDQVLLKDFVDDLSQQAKYLFLTTLTKDYYIRFDPLLPTFGAVMPT